MEQNISIPIYKKIALDMANRIYHEDIKVGEKVHGRSTLAGEYNVSPETIRRSMKLLEDMDVVIINKGSGITIISKENANTFINRFQDIESIGTLKLHINNLMEEKKSIEEEINNVLGKIIDYSSRLKNVNPINTVEIELPQKSNLIGKTISSCKFWQNTGGTIVGIRRRGTLIISPGPYAVFEKNDIILVVGEEKVMDSINKYLGK